jgi:hypothetical protein
MQANLKRGFNRVSPDQPSRCDLSVRVQELSKKKKAHTLGVLVLFSLDPEAVIECGENQPRQLYYSQ